MASLRLASCTAAVVLAALLGLSAPAAAQGTTPVRDVGMTLDFGPWLPAFVGYDCGTFSCTPLNGGGYGAGALRTFTAFGAPNTPYAIAVGVPGQCTNVPGIGNSLLLAPPIAALHLGTTGPLISGSSCRQGMDRFPFTMPMTVPTGITIRFQSIGLGNGPVLAFGPAIDVVLR